jgi:hypothetical protein
MNSRFVTAIVITIDRGVRRSPAAPGPHARSPAHGSVRSAIRAGPPAATLVLTETGPGVTGTTPSCLARRRWPRAARRRHGVRRDALPLSDAVDAARLFARLTLTGTVGASLTVTGRRMSGQYLVTTCAGGRTGTSTSLCSNVCRMATIVIFGALDTKAPRSGSFAPRSSAEAIAPWLSTSACWGRRLSSPASRGREVALAAGDAATLGDVGRAGRSGPRRVDHGPGAAAVAGRLHREGRLDAVVGLGGGAGTSVATAAMRALPLGIPRS